MAPKPSAQICMSIDSYTVPHQIWHGLVARIAGSHPAGPGLIHGAGNIFCPILLQCFERALIQKQNLSMGDMSMIKMTMFC